MSKPPRAVLYARVSTRTGEQDPAAQLGALRDWAVTRGWVVVREEEDRITSDPRRRGKDPPGLARALRLLEDRRADVLAVFAADRLVADPLPLLQLVARVQQLGGQIASLQDGRDLDTTTDNGELLVFLNGWYNRLRLRLNRAATLAGLDRAAAEGRRGGRPRAALDLVELRRLRDGQGLGWDEIGARLGCSGDTARRRWLASGPGVAGAAEAGRSAPRHD